jgi:hypothetical protein
MALTFPFGSGRRRSQGARPDVLGAVYGDMPQANAVIVYISLEAIQRVREGKVIVDVGRLSTARHK